MQPVKTAVRVTEQGRPTTLMPYVHEREEMIITLDNSVKLKVLLGVGQLMVLICH
ncbi:MAG: hypothetical protein ACR5K4_01890 [Sodalis sp. (in: enterobacteria)]